MGKLYIGNLTFDTKERDLEKKFERFGKIVKTNIAYDSDKKSKGFGFVVFDDDDDAEEARNKVNGGDINGRRVQVDWAKDSGADRDKEVNKNKPRRNESNGQRRDRSGSRSPERLRDRDRSHSDASIPRKKPPPPRERADKDRDPPRDRDKDREPPRDRSRSRQDDRRDADRGRGRDRSPTPRKPALRERSPDRGRDESLDRDRGRDRSTDRDRRRDGSPNRDRRRDPTPERALAIRSADRSRDAGRREPERLALRDGDDAKRELKRADDRNKRKESHEKALADLGKITSEADELRDDRKQLVGAVQKYLDAKQELEKAEQDLKLLLGKLSDDF